MPDISKLALLFADEMLPPPPQQSLTQTFVMVTIAMAFFYVIMWRPEQKRRKELDNARAAMKKGDLVTAVGIVGTVAAVKDNTILLKTGEGAKLEVLKAAISEVIPSQDE